MRIHYLQHVHFEGLGYIETWLKENKYQISVTRFYEHNYRLPSTAEIDALIVMGGPMGVYDEARYSWLEEEKTFIRECIQTGKKVLGICLGAQLIAACLDAKVDKAKHKEIGWFPVMPTAKCTQLSWFYDLFKNNPIVFHWHGDKFDIPDGSSSFLNSQANNNQAFFYGDNVIALQFHLEVTAQTIEQMLENGQHELSNTPYIQTEQEIRNGAINIQQCNEMMSIILSKWVNS